jgi:hypothetical protein
LCPPVPRKSAAGQVPALFFRGIVVKSFSTPPPAACRSAATAAGGKYGWLAQ